MSMQDPTPCELYLDCDGIQWFADHRMCQAADEAHSALVELGADVTVCQIDTGLTHGPLLPPPAFFYSQAR